MRIIVVSTHRSDKAHYAPLLRCLRATAGLDVTLYAVNDFYAKPDYIEAVRPLAATLGKNAPKTFDAAVVLGDRYEMLLAAMQLVEARIPLLHIHGGEHTYGSLDERWRWAMTAIADVHCVATKDAGHAVAASFHGEEGWENWERKNDKVMVTGAPGLDDIHARSPFPNAPRIVVLYNPGMDELSTKKEVEAISHGVSAWTDVWWIQPNGDRFSDLIPYTHDGLDQERFRDLLAATKVLVGNSSAGIIEAPSLGAVTVNVGERQAGRPRAESVADLPADAERIETYLSWQLSFPRRGPWPNPYGDGHASERIRDVLLEMGK